MILALGILVILQNLALKGLSRDCKNVSAFVSASGNNRSLSCLDVSFGLKGAPWKWVVKGRAFEKEYSARCERDLDVSDLLSAYGISWF